MKGKNSSTHSEQRPCIPDISQRALLAHDMNRRLRAFDADSGEILWETILGGIIQTSTITYSVNGVQYVAVLTGDGASGTSGPLRQFPELKPPRGHNAIYAFALPQRP